MVGDERARRISVIAGVLSGVVIALVVLGYWFAVWLFAAAPSFVPAPGDAVTPGHYDEVFRVGVVALVYWVGAFTVALGVVVAITVLGVRTLERLWECSSASLIVPRVDEADPAVTIARIAGRAGP
ncbi:hypothetical protein [Leifsonia poae]|uniref:Uncharacterized protein n=1 Tax=Leifsonia poae TaxID=110933 RepID=A0A9W6H8I3_9MICO|nr:hypothetical protein [Leifsonia poae]GLJ75637.1 hypothetical protein GCM10017584_12110 [Leifsonia poae]